MRIAVIPVLGLLLTGCQLIAQRTSTDPVPVVITKAQKSTVLNAAYVILPTAGDDGVRRYEIRSSTPGKNLDGWPLAAEIRALSRQSAKNGGPTYSLATAAPPTIDLPASLALDTKAAAKECIVDPELRRVLKSKKVVCYTAEDAGTIAVYTLPE